MDPKRKFLVGGLIAGGLLLLYGMGFIHWVELKSEESRLKKEVAHLQIENRRLSEEAHRLREDPAYAEAVARQQLGFTRPGETIVKFTNRKTIQVKK